jgi:hypothetical protein
MGTNSIGSTEWERDFDPKTEQPYRREGHSKLVYNKETRTIDVVQPKIEILWRLIADLSDNLRDEGCDYSPDGLDAIRTQVANTLPAAVRPAWLLPYCNPAIIRTGD